MITEEINGHKITMWESIDEMPIDRYYAFNRYMMLSDGLGNSFSDIEQTHIRPLVQVIDDKAKAMQQIANMRELMFNIINGLSFEHRAYCTLIYSIDGEVMVGHSESDIDAIILRLSQMGVTNGGIKKKMTA